MEIKCRFIFSNWIYTVCFFRKKKETAYWYSFIQIGCCLAFVVRLDESQDVQVIYAVEFVTNTFVFVEFFPNILWEVY